MPPAPGVGSDVKSELGLVEEAVGEKRRRDVAAYLMIYRVVGEFGFIWGKAGYDWIKERLADCNLGWAKGYSERRSRYLRHPDLRAGEVHVFLDESWVYEGGIARHTWALGGDTTMREKGYYRRWGIIGVIGRMWGEVSHEVYAANQPPRKNERYSWATGSSGIYYQIRCFTIRELGRIWNTGLQNDDHPAFGEAGGQRKATVRNNIGGVEVRAFADALPG